MLELLIGSLLFGLAIAIHELGHLFAARLTGIPVVTVSLGFGRRLFKKKLGETVWCVSVVPLGGYIRPYSNEINDTSVKRSGFHDFIAPISAIEVDLLETMERSKRKGLESASFTKKFFFICNGLVFNLLSAAVVLAAGTYIYGQLHNLLLPPKFTAISTNSLAYTTGFKSGDLIIRVGGRPVDTWSDVAIALNNDPAEKLPIDVRRNDSVVTIDQKNQYLPINDERLGYWQSVGLRNLTIIESFEAAMIALPQISLNILRSALATNSTDQPNDSARSQLGFVGPILQIGTMAKESIASAMYLFVTLSLVLVFLNMLPFPSFDGGHLLILIIENIRGKNFTSQAKTRIGTLGLATSFALICAGIVGDLYRSFSFIFSP